MKTFSVPARWMRETVVNGYRIQPCLDAKRVVGRVTKGDLFYRLHHPDGTCTDHGSLDGAIYAAKRG